MLDAVISMTDIVTSFWSLGLPRDPDPAPFILDTFAASDGWFVMQLVREHQFERLADVVGFPQWKADPRFATREGWSTHLDSDIRPAIETWAATMTKREAAAALMEAGVAAAPCLEAEEVVDEKLVADRNMLVAMERTDGVGQPVLVPGNPVKLSNVAQGPETRVPWVGEHTDEILRTELGLSDSEIADLRAAGVVS
jgi:crotonobetainyl-CoA:carnitine CoA-transferase CaiB-like acyl-CoA transferase